MVYARPKIPPTRNGSKVKSVDDSAARKVKGYLQSLVLDDPSDTVPGWVMVIAETYPAAIRAADAVKVDWTPGPGATVSEKDIQNHAAQLIAQPDAGALLDTGDYDTAAAFRAAKSTLEQTYTTATVLHFQLEPVNALAFEKDGLFEVHAGNQWQTLILPTLAKALDGPETSIVMRSYMLGGGFGRRLNGDHNSARRARREGARQTGEDGADPRRRCAIRLGPLAFGPNAAHGVWRGRPGDGDGASCGGRLADAGRGSIVHDQRRGGRAC